MTTFADLFDAMCDRLGPESAADIMRQTTAYRDAHHDCDLPGGVEIVDDGRDVEIRFGHAPTCPALTEGANHDR